MSLPFIIREFEVDGEQVECRFYQPEKAEVDFLCRYRIEWPEGAKEKKTYGVDQVQALLLAMQNAHAELLFAREKEKRRVEFLEDENLSLPLASSVRDWAPKNSY